MIHKYKNHYLFDSKAFVFRISPDKVNKDTRLKTNVVQILSHSAGLSASGIPDYEINKQLPSILEVLNGAHDVANTKAC